MNDLFKVGEFFLNYFLGKKNFIGEKSLEISADILNQLRRILILVVMTLGSLTLFCMGMNYLIERFLNNLDNGQSLMTPSIWFILFFLAICIGVMVYATRKQNWLSIFKAEPTPAAVPQLNHGAHQIESVISLLILDFIKERELKREQQKTNSKSE
jgi:ABC-type multidrug transport system fused ATPase/permease subunit